MLITAAYGTFISLTQAQERARGERGREHAATILLDQLERELIGTQLFIKPKGGEREKHPWVFVARDNVFGTGENDSLLFITQNPAGYALLAMKPLRLVGYTLVASAAPGDIAERFDLHRWDRRLPEETLVRELPLEMSVRVVHDVRRFDVALIDEEGESHDGWDSTEIATLDRLPVQVAITVQLEHLNADGELVAGPDVTRRIDLPVRPREMLSASGCPGSGATVGSCLARYTHQISQHDQVSKNLVAKLKKQLPPDTCWNETDPSNKLVLLRGLVAVAAGVEYKEVCP
jgi:hypothetical protein